MVFFSLEPILAISALKISLLKHFAKDTEGNVGAMVIVMKSVTCIQNGLKTKLMNYLKLLIIVVKNTRGKEKENHVNYLKFVFHWTDHDYKILPLSTVCLGTLKFLIRERSFSNISFEMYKDYCGRC